jgi:hypothetical protein
MAEQNVLLQEKVLRYKLYSHFPVHFTVLGFPTEHLNYNCMVAFLYNSQARGEITWQSAIPDVPLRINPKFLSHPYDLRVSIEALREILKIVNHPAYAKDTLADIIGPKKTGLDEDLLEFCKENISSSWHMTDAAKMVKAAEPDTVVEKNFRLTHIVIGAGRSHGWTGSGGWRRRSLRFCNPPKSDTKPLDSREES